MKKLLLTIPFLLIASCSAAPKDKVENFNVFGEQEHQYGFQIESDFKFNEIEYEWAVGYLHGLTDASANHTIIWNFEVEFF